MLFKMILRHHILLMISAKVLRAQEIRNNDHLSDYYLLPNYIGPSTAIEQLKCNSTILVGIIPSILHKRKMRLQKFARLV